MSSNVIGQQNGVGEYIFTNLDNSYGGQTTELLKLEKDKVTICNSVVVTPEGLVGGPFTAGGDLSGTSTSQTVIGLQGNAVSNSSPNPDDVLTWDSELEAWKPAAPSSGSFTAGGDLSGTSTSQTVIKIQGKAVSTNTPNGGDVLTWDSEGSTWNPVAPPSAITDVITGTGITVSTPEGQPTVRQVTLDTPVSPTYGGTGWNSSESTGVVIVDGGEWGTGVVPLASTAPELSVYKSDLAAEEGVVTISPSDGTAQYLDLLTEVTDCTLDTTGLGSLSVSVAVLIKNNTEGALNFKASPTLWIGSDPSTVSVGAGESYLLVLTNFGTDIVVGSWTALAVAA